MLQNKDRMKGWLYIIRSNRFGLQYSRRRYFVLRDNCLKSFKSVPESDKEEPVRSAIIDSCIRVTDNGRETSHRKVLFIFTIYSTSDHDNQLKLGANSPEDAAKWIHSLQDTALKDFSNVSKGFVSCSKKRWQPFRLGLSRRSRHYTNSFDWTLNSSPCMSAMTSDVIAPSPWKIFGCQNGLRLFREAKDRDLSRKHWDDYPAIMAVGVVDGTSEAIFRTLMSLGTSRSEWDFCFCQGSVIEHLDGHTDIIHKQLHSNFLPRGMKRRDLLLQRYWRREDDGTYVILYHSVYHKNCPSQRGYVRACIKSGGYVISPLIQGRQSVVKHMLAIDWKFWKSYIKTSSAQSITIRMIERVAALRELFRAKAGRPSSSDFLSGELAMDIGLSHSEPEKIIDEREGDIMKINQDCLPQDEVVDGPQSKPASLLGLNDADEFFDVPEPADFDLDNDPTSIFSSILHSPEGYQPRASTAAGFVKKLHDFTVHKKGYVDLQDVAREDGGPCHYGTTLLQDPTCSSPCSWSTADPSSFLVRGETYLHDNQKVKAKDTLMQMVGADWLRSNKREDDLGGRVGSIVRSHAAQGRPEFFLVVNLQVPGSTTHSLSLYYMTRSRLEDTPSLDKFVKGDDTYRNSRFKLIPYISQGSWIVKQSVGKKACLIGQALEVNYFHGKNYLELAIDVGSSTVARGVVNLVLGYVNKLVIELAFLIQANTEEELPECLLGTCRLNHLDASKSVIVNP